MDKNQELIRLFKAVEVTDKNKTREIPTEIMAETIQRGFVFSPVVAGNVSDHNLTKLIETIEKEVGLTPEKLNSSFHKSWEKIRDASDEQLLIEQLIHYFTTYGLENMGLYNKDTVYIPNE